jgi:hypothetical protein
MLAIAACLTPDPDGLGTHRQLLDWPPCGFLLLTGRPCPSCGMTTAWAHLVRGNVTASLAANAGGFLTALFAGPLAIWTLASSVRGRWVWGGPNLPLMLGASVSVVAATWIQWWLR